MSHQSTLLLSLAMILATLGGRVEHERQTLGLAFLVAAAHTPPELDTHRRVWRNIPFDQNTLAAISELAGGVQTDPGVARARQQDGIQVPRIE